eukprot:6207045-Pleurochrysis_carterae.AAC.1
MQLTWDEGDWWRKGDSTQLAKMGIGARSKSARLDRTLAPSRNQRIVTMDEYVCMSMGCVLHSLHASGMDKHRTFSSALTVVAPML